MGQNIASPGRRVGASGTIKEEILRQECWDEWQRVTEDREGRRQGSDHPGNACVRVHSHLRRPVAVLLGRFPTVTETFILREVDEIERQGRPVILVPVIREHPPIVHDEARKWMDRALFTPLRSPHVIATIALTAARNPGGVLRAAWGLLAACGADHRALRRSLPLIPKALHIAAVLERRGVDHVHAHFAHYPATLARLVSQFAPVTYSFTAHAHDIFVPWIRVHLEQNLRGARFVRVISRFNRDYLEALYPDAVRGKIRVIHMGIDPSRYHASPVASGEPPRLLVIASLKPYKGIPVLVEACARLRERGLRFTCDHIGDGPMREEVEALIRTRNLSHLFTLHGPLPQQEVARRIAHASLLVMPSVIAEDGTMEGIPVALMEALAAGLPVVASSLSGIPELVEDGKTGLLVPPGDPEALAEAVLSLVRDPELARGLGERGRARVRDEFDKRGCVSQLDQEIARFVPSVEDGESRLLPREWIGLRGVRWSRDAKIAEILIGGRTTTSERILKRHIERAGKTPSASERARREHRILAALGRRGLPVPEALGFDEERAEVLMSRCPGVPLVDLIRRHRWRPGAKELEGLLDAVRAAGAWLRSFQQQTRDVAELSNLLLPQPITEETGALRTQLTRLRTRMTPESIRPCGHHGDFWPGNIWVVPESRSVQVIDFDATRWGLPYEDVGTFLDHLALLTAYPLLGRFRQTLRSAFLDGYLADLALDPAALAHGRITAGRVILANQPPPRGLVARLHAWRRGRILRRICLRAGRGSSSLFGGIRMETEH